jgi:sialate O-acetylesterase
VTSLADAFHVPAYFLTGTGESLIAVVDNAIKQHAWAVFGFHGVGGDHAAVTTEAHEALLAYLEQQSSAVRVLPFGAAAECMKQR